MNPPNESRHCGPYTQIQRQKRRDDVYVMYFEKGMSGLKIAASLGINRNTINEDIKFLTSQITNKLESHDVNMLLAKKLEMMEVQRQRLLENLESANFEQRLRIEKFVFEIDCKITSLFSKITPVEHPVKSKITPTMLSSLIKSMCYSEIIEHPKFAGVESIRRAIFSITGGIFSLSMEAERMLFLSLIHI